MNLGRTVRNLAYLLKTGNLGILQDYLAGRHFTVETPDGAKIPGKRGEAVVSVLADQHRRGREYLPYSRDFILMSDGENVLLQKKDFPVMYGWVDRLCHDVEPGQNVLDVGGYLGETAVWFKSYGEADQVYVYEPVEANVDAIERNALLNGYEDDIHIVEAGAAAETGTITITSETPPGDISFGEPGKGTEYEEEVTVRSWQNILEEAIQNNVSLAHLNCEGAEKHLDSVPEDILSGINHWFIACHSRDIYRKLTQLFEDAGFEVELVGRNHPKIECRQV